MRQGLPNELTGSMEERVAVHTLHQSIAGVSISMNIEHDSPNYWIPTICWLKQENISKESVMVQKMTAFGDNQNSAFCQGFQSYENKRRSARTIQSAVY